MLACLTGLLLAWILVLFEDAFRCVIGCTFAAILLDAVTSEEFLAKTKAFLLDNGLRDLQTHIGAHMSYLERKVGEPLRVSVLNEKKLHAQL